MPVNALKKDTARGNGPPPTLASDKEVRTAADEQSEAELAAKEIEAMWESQEVGITRWSESDGKRYAD